MKRPLKWFSNLKTKLNNKQMENVEEVASLKKEVLEAQAFAFKHVLNKLQTLKPLEK